METIGTRLGIVAAALLLSACTDIYQMSQSPTPARTLLATREQIVKLCSVLPQDGVVCLWGAPRIAKTGLLRESVGRLDVPQDRDPRSSSPGPGDFLFAWMEVTLGQVVDGYQTYQGTMCTGWTVGGYYSIRHGFDDISWNVVNRSVRTIATDGSDQATALAAFLKQARADEDEALASRAQAAYEAVQAEMAVQEKALKQLEAARPHNPSEISTELVQKSAKRVSNWGGPGKFEFEYSDSLITYDVGQDLAKGTVIFGVDNHSDRTVKVEPRFIKIKTALGSSSPCSFAHLSMFGLTPVGLGVQVKPKSRELYALAGCDARMPYLIKDPILSMSLDGISLRK